MRDLQELVAPLLELCVAAGDVICEHYHAPGADRFEAKGDDSPLTHADLASDRILQQGLARLQPSLPVLSEESPDSRVRERHGWPTFWLVDPLDGTREFLARTGEFTINIALIDEHRPVLGVLYLPLAQVAYLGIPGASAQRFERETGGTWRSAALSCARLEEGRSLVVLASRRHRGRRLGRCLDWLAGEWPATERRDSGSALKFCHMAQGEGDFYPRFSRCCEWDVAAGQALLEAAGGAILGLDGRPLRYNLGDSLYSPNFYAIADPAHPLWQRLAEQRPVDS
ncbi:MAG: 3'(2'),5'-bisphosphate nucleotidase CysQ [Halioglobus sp.]|nr:3'(2'),5'-bisphosphate nucleotidase CysQ [Halioglobus sp.]